MLVFHSTVRSHHIGSCPKAAAGRGPYLGAQSTSEKSNQIDKMIRLAVEVQ
jgi:hypothetical protein